MECMSSSRNENEVDALHTREGEGEPKRSGLLLLLLLSWDLVSFLVIPAYAYSRQGIKGLTWLGLPRSWPHCHDERLTNDSNWDPLITLRSGRFCPVPARPTLTRDGAVQIYCPLTISTGCGAEYFCPLSLSLLDLCSADCSADCPRHGGRCCRCMYVHP